MSSTAHTSDAQLNDNRQNATLSTGPRSDEAKQRTRLNGPLHGLTGQTIVMPYEDRQVYEDFCAATIADLQPADDIERGLAQSIASETWRLNRSRAIEGNIFVLGIAIDLTAENEDTDPAVHAALTQAQTYLDHARELALLSLYANRIARSIDKTRAELKALQSAANRLTNKPSKKPSSSRNSPSPKARPVNTSTKMALDFQLPKSTASSTAATA